MKFYFIFCPILTTFMNSLSKIDKFKPFFFPSRCGNFCVFFPLKLFVVNLTYKGKEIVFRFIIKYSS